MSETPSSPQLSPPYAHEERRRVLAQVSHHALAEILGLVRESTDASVIARSLLETYGSVHQMMKASTDHLLSIEGMDPIVVRLLRSFEALHHEVLRERLDFAESPTMADARTMADFLREKIGWHDRRSVMVLYLDHNLKLITYEELTKGTEQFVTLPVRDLVTSSLQLRASGLVVGHNHPNGDFLPSAADDAITGDLSHALGYFGITLHDHLVVSPSGSYSYAYSRTLQQVSTPPKRVFPPDWVRRRDKKL